MQKIVCETKNIYPHNYVSKLHNFNPSTSQIFPTYTSSTLYTCMH